MTTDRQKEGGAQAPWRWAEQSVTRKTSGAPNVSAWGRPLPLRGHVLFQLPEGRRPFGCPTSDPPERTPQLTHQGNPVGVERAESHLGDELGAGEKQEVEVEEVFELVKQHLQWGKETLEAGGLGARQTRDLSNTPPEHNSRGTCTYTWHSATCCLGKLTWVMKTPWVTVKMQMIPLGILNTKFKTMGTSGCGVPDNSC